MVCRIGILLLDWTDVVVRIYEKDNQRFTMIFKNTHDLSLQPDVLNSGNVFIKTIKQAAQKGSQLHVEQWKVYARYLPKGILREIAQAISFPITHLSLEQEQDLLCKGTLLES